MLFRIRVDVYGGAVFRRQFQRLVSKTVSQPCSDWHRTPPARKNSCIPTTNSISNTFNQTNLKAPLITAMGLFRLSPKTDSDVISVTLYRLQPRLAEHIQGAQADAN